MSDLQDIIAHNAHRAYEQGVTREQERIIKLLEPLAEHDIDCDVSCYRDECSAGYFEHAISLIQAKL